MQDYEYVRGFSVWCTLFHHWREQSHENYSFGVVVCDKCKQFTHLNPYMGV